MNGLIEDHGKFYSALDEYIIARLSHYLVEGSMFIWFQCDTQIRPTLTVYCTAATTSMHVYLIYVVLNDMLLLISARESPEPLSNYRSPQTPGHRAGEWLMVISAPNKQASPWQRQTSKLLLSSKLLIILRKHCKSLRNHRCISLVFPTRCIASPSWYPEICANTKLMPNCRSEGLQQILTVKSLQPQSVSARCKDFSSVSVILHRSSIRCNISLYG